MPTTKKEIREMIEVVTLSIRREIDAHSFYLHAAERAGGESSKELFLALASQEKGHEAVLKTLLENLKRQLKDLEG